MNPVKSAFALLRYAPIALGVNWNDQLLMKDIKRWKVQYHLQCRDWYALAVLLYCYPEFRNLFIYRNRFRRVYRTWIGMWYRPMDTLYIQTKEIGGGFFIQHGFATMISAESIGENCWVNQQVTIGYKGDGERAPVIRNNVMITCGAKVLGPITVEDNVVIGANAVVITDVKSNSVVGGIPARRIK